MSETTIKTASAKNRWPMILIFLIPFTAMTLAWVMYFTGAWVPDGRTNKGDLMLPPAQFSELHLKESGEEFNFEKLDGNWGILVFGSTSCSEQACQEVLYKTRQVHIALGKEAERVMRVYVAKDAPETTKELNFEHPNIFWLNSSEEPVLKTLGVDQWPENRFFIVDPLGNIMMGYQADQVGGDLLKDLKKLLKTSSIG